MLRLRDAGTGRLVELPASKAPMTRILVAPERAGALSVLRAALVADLIRRLVELQGGQAQLLATVELPGLLPFNVHPSTPTTGEPVQVTVGVGAPGRLVLPVAAVTGEAPAEADPLTLRLVLLGTPYALPAAIEESELAEAERQLQRWRRRIVDWASLPSGAMPAHYVARLYNAAEADLDMPRVLAVLEQAADDETVAAGSRFELLLHADRILGLDLVSGLSGG